MAGKATGHNSRSPWPQPTDSIVNKCWCVDVQLCHLSCPSIIPAVASPQLCTITFIDRAWKPKLGHSVACWPSVMWCCCR